VTKAKSRQTDKLDKMKVSATPVLTVEQALFTELRSLIISARQQVAQTVNVALTTLYWQVGNRIRREMLKEKRAEYGAGIVRTISAQLEAEFGRGFSRRNIFQMVRFSEVFPDLEIVQSLIAQLGWTHFQHIIRLDNQLKRNFYSELCRLENWDTRTLNKKIQSMLYERSALSRKPDELIEVELQELRDEDKLTPDLVFRDPYFLDFLGLNLVFVDEGHKGQKSEESTWKRLQDDLAGIDSPQEKHRGLLIEFSATFGQVAELEHAFDRYAKSVVFDYAYDRFHADNYGKDFWHVKMEGRGDIEDVVQQQTLTAALLSFWHQITCYRNGASQAYLRDKGVSVSSPLWVLLGLSVIGGKNRSDQEQTSDVIDVLRYFSAILENQPHLSGSCLKLHIASRKVRRAAITVWGLSRNAPFRKTTERNLHGKARTITAAGISFFQRTEMFRCPQSPIDNRKQRFLRSVGARQRLPADTCSR